MKPASNLGVSTVVYQMNSFDSDGDILTQISAQADAVVEAYQLEPTLTDSEPVADKDRTLTIGRLSFPED